MFVGGIQTCCCEGNLRRNEHRHGATGKMGFFPKVRFFYCTRVEFEYSDFAHIIVVGCV